MPGSLKRRRTITQPHQAGGIHTRWPSRTRTRAKAKNRNVRVPRNKLAFPQSISTKLRYTEKINMGSVGAATTTVINQFIANGAYDPNYTGVGHQPRGFDQFMSSYEAYTVTGSKMSVNFVYDAYQGPSTEALAGEMEQPAAVAPTIATKSAASSVMCGIHKGMVALAAGSAEEQMEKDRTSWVIMTPNGEPKTLSTSMKTSDFFGTTGSLIGREGFIGTDSQNPVNKVYYEVWVGRINPYTAGILRVQAYVTIEYDITFSEPKPLVQS